MGCSKPHEMDLTKRLRGKTVAEVSTDGRVLRIVTTSNEMIDIAWLTDGAMFKKGFPICVRHGVKVDARGFVELIAASAKEYPR